MQDLGIVIVNYNVSELLRRCLTTVLASQGDFGFAVVVVDNASPDDSVAMIRTRFPQVTLIANDENRGYPAANNQGLRTLGIAPDPAGAPPEVGAFSQAPLESQSRSPGPAAREGVVATLEPASPSFRPRYALLLNPDTEVPPFTLARLLDYMDAHPDVGVVGPKLLLTNGELDHACRRGFPTPRAAFYYMLGLSRLFPHSERFGRYDLKHLDVDELAEVDSVTGAFMLVRTAAIDQVGLLDERFWMYGEDLDWSKRIKDQGWRVVYNPAVSALHVKGASGQSNPRARLEFYRSMPIFYYKHYWQETPRWLHWLVLCGIALKGGRRLWPDIRLGPAILERRQVSG